MESKTNIIINKNVQFWPVRYADALVENLKDKLIINEVFSNATQLEGLSSWQEKLIVSKLYFLSEVCSYWREFSSIYMNIKTQIGGVMLPLDRLCIGSLEYLWYKESFIAIDESENIISMGGHQVKFQDSYEFNTWGHFINRRRGFGRMRSQLTWAPAFRRKLVMTFSWAVSKNLLTYPHWCTVWKNWSNLKDNTTKDNNIYSGGCGKISYSQ